jgi:hypothetical protein
MGHTDSTGCRRGLSETTWFVKGHPRRSVERVGDELAVVVRDRVGVVSVEALDRSQRHA